MTKLLAKLNKAQRLAVTHTDGPAIVLAGAGSGKTKVLTTRAAFLLSEKKVTPEEILLVTFTNKAAGEMKQRLEKLTGNKLPFVSTFHSFTAKLLRRHALEANLNPNFLIYDSAEQLSLLKSIYKEYGLNEKDIKPQAAKAVISKAKNELISPSGYEELAYGDFQTKIARVYKLYEQALSKAGALDFDDLLKKVVELFNSNSKILKQYQRQFAHVLIDEYQDTNKVQYELGKLLAKPLNNIFIVGDFSQSIYAWRGADYRNLMNFKTDFAQVSEYRLEENYRSSQSILDAATQVISQNTTHPILKLWTKNERDEKITVIETENQKDEAQRVVREINKLKRETSLEEIAILYRTNAQSREFEEALLSFAIPYKVVGGFKFYERQEIKDVLAMLKFLLNPNDQVSHNRLLKIGKRRTQKIINFREENKQWRDHLDEPAKILEQLIKVSSYKDKFDPKDSDDYSRLENLTELLNTAQNFSDSFQFLENVALIQDEQMSDLYKEDNGAVTLMSLHSAKGLEFEIIFMVGMEEGLMPHSRSLFNKEELEEERRLCYVGITRAKRKLYFSYAKKRFSYRGSSFNTVSRFLSEIDPELLETNTGQNFYNQKTPKRSYHFEDEELEGVLSGDLDIEAFLDN